MSFLNAHADTTYDLFYESLGSTYLLLHQDNRSSSGQEAVLGTALTRPCDTGILQEYWHCILYNPKAKYLIDMTDYILAIFNARNARCASKGAGRDGVLLYLDLWGVLFTILLFT